MYEMISTVRLNLVKILFIKIGCIDPKFRHIIFMPKL